MWNFFSKDPSKELVNFEVQESVALESDLQNKTIWSINNAKKKGSTAGTSGSVSQPAPNELLYSVFSCQAKPGNEQAITAAKNAYRRTKTLRHPNILLFQDGVDSDKAVYIVTERVQPLASYLRESKDNESQKENEISWGLYQIATALSFLNTDCKIIHNNVNLASVVVNRAGEWKLTGFEFAHGIDDSHTPYKCLPSLDCYEPPERSPVANLKSSARDSNSIEQLHAADSWGLGVLIWEIFNGFLPNLNALKNPGQIPKRLIGAYSELLNSQPSKRLNSAKFISYCRQSNGFMSNHFVDTLLFLEEIQIKDQNEKSKFFQDLTEKLDDFPGQLCRFKILPQLLNAYEFGNAGSTILPPLFKLGKLLDENEYQKKIIPIVVKLFSSTDRATRMRLLQQMHLFIEHLSAAIINDQIFPHICAGFTDTNPAIRESTIRSMVLLAPKLNYNNLNVELMKHFARLQAQDDQGMIRTNTTVCIGKIAPFINPQLRQRILLSAFPKAMRDPFPLARLSGLIAMANTDRFYTLKDIATRVLPCLCALTVDPEKDVRDEAFRTIKTFMLKLEKVSETPEMALELEKDVQACNLDVKNETSWTSWAVTSLSAKMSAYKGKNVQPSIALNTQPLNTPGSGLVGAGDKKPDETSPSSSSIKPKAAAASASASQLQRDDEKSSSFGQMPIVGNSSSSTNVTTSGGGGGWADFDDNEWKDLDDDPMEPFESFESPKTASKPASKPTTTTTTTANSDWSSDWSSSFDTTAAIEPTKTTTNQKPDPKLAATSSYNWASSTNKNSGVGFVDDKTKNEEDLFSSLVKDVSISSSNKPSASNNKSDWGDNWNDVFENTPTREAKQRPQKKTTTTGDGGETKPKSGPLKLGQKKPQDFF